MQDELVLRILSHSHNTGNISLVCKSFSTIVDYLRRFLLPPTQDEIQDYIKTTKQRTLVWYKVPNASWFVFTPLEEEIMILEVVDDTCVAGKRNLSVLTKGSSSVANVDSRVAAKIVLSRPCVESVVSDDNSTLAHRILDEQHRGNLRRKIRDNDCVRHVWNRLVVSSGAEDTKALFDRVLREWDRRGSIFSWLDEGDRIVAELHSAR